MTITSEMREAGLNGNGLLIYAIIYGYSQEQDGCCYASLATIAKRAGCSGETARNILKSLTEDGFVERFEFMDNGVRRVAYRTTQKIKDTQKSLPDPPKNLEDTPQKIWENNKGYNKDNTKTTSVYNSAPARFKIPTLEEVTAYCRERGNLIDPQQFIDHYTANGWRVGGNPMKDWRACVRTWEARRRETSTPQAPRPRPRYESPEEHNLRILRQMQERDGMLHTFTPDEQ